MTRVIMIVISIKGSFKTLTRQSLRSETVRYNLASDRYDLACGGLSHSNCGASVRVQQRAYAVVEATAFLAQSPVLGYLAELQLNG